MNKNHLRILYVILIIGTGVAIALISAGTRIRDDSNLSPSLNTDLRAAAVYQAVSPTPAAQDASEAGSTDSIMLMGVIIVVIVILPILLRKSTWKK